MTPDEMRAHVALRNQYAAERLARHVTGPIQFGRQFTGKFYLGDHNWRGNWYDASDADDPMIVELCAAHVQTELSRAGWPLRVKRWQHATWWRKGWIEVAPC
jgi:hypothetical protein